MNTTSERTLAGTGVTPLAGVGRVTWYGQSTDLDDPPDPATVDEATERERFETAHERARDEVRAERERTAERVGEAEAEIFDAHLQFLDDPQIVGSVRDALDSGLSAEHAVKRGFEEPIATLENADGVTAERADDLRDIRDRLVRLLMGADRVDLSTLPAGTVIVAERLTPSDTAQLDPDRVAGLATVLGGRTSHVAIFARSLGIPAVVGVGDALEEVAEGDEVVVDGVAGQVIIDPDRETRATATERRDVAVRTERVSTKGGKSIEVAANVGTVAELDVAVDRGADGIGLFRTEFLFLDREAPPSEDEQFDAYVAALDAFPDGRVVVRTLDVGGDKPIPYLDLPEETNPFLGTRGIRRSLAADTDLFETQLRALLRAGAAGAGDLAVTFPLVSTVDELDAALERVDAVRDDLSAAGIDHERPELGVMVETPASVWLAEELADRVSFLSIGTNDLTQYVMAASRENDGISDLHDPLHPSVLRAIERAVDAGHDADAWVGMCGEMAGDPDLTGLLLGFGLDELSTTAVTIPDVKASVTDVDLDEASSIASRACDASTLAEVREQISTDP